MTEKKLKLHLRRIWFHYDRLRTALNEAHGADIIVYDAMKYSELAPCWAADELSRRVKATTQKAIAETITKEVRRTI